MWTTWSRTPGLCLLLVLCGLGLSFCGLIDSVAAQSQPVEAQSPHAQMQGQQSPVHAQTQQSPPPNQQAPAPNQQTLPADEGHTALLDRPLAVVTTTMLGAALSDLAGEWVEPVALIPPEGCPGHFDLSPKDLGNLERATFIFRHDYQEWLNDGLHATQREGQHFGVLTTSGTQTLPEHYLSLCVQLAAQVSRAFPEHATEIGFRLAEIQDRVKDLDEREHKRAQAKVKGMPLLVASFQSDFVGWAGARVVATFDRAEEMSVEQMNTLISTAKKERAKGLVGNLQWGDREVRSLSESLHIPSVVLSNYPASCDPRAFDELLVSNVSKLISLTGDE